MERHLKHYNWYNIIYYVRHYLEPHTSITISKNIIAHPLNTGFKKTIGEPLGQIADYEYILSDGSRVHVREYENTYEVHWDVKSPTVDLIGHLIYDSPHVLISILCGITEGLNEYVGTKDYEKALTKAIIGAFAMYIGFKITKLLVKTLCCYRNRVFRVNSRLEGEI